MSTTRICIHEFVPSITLSVAHHLDCHFADPTTIKGCLICNDVLLPSAVLYSQPRLVG